MTNQCECDHVSIHPKGGCKAKGRECKFEGDAGNPFGGINCIHIPLQPAEPPFEPTCGKPIHVDGRLVGGCRLPEGHDDTCVTQSGGGGDVGSCETCLDCNYMRSEHGPCKCGKFIAQPPVEGCAYCHRPFSEHTTDEKYPACDTYFHCPDGSNNSYRPAAHPPVECAHPLLVDDVFMTLANRDGGWRCDTCAKTFVFLPADVVAEARKDYEAARGMYRLHRTGELPGNHGDGEAAYVLAQMYTSFTRVHAALLPKEGKDGE